MATIQLKAIADMTGVERASVAYHRLIKKNTEANKELAKSARNAGKSTQDGFNKAGRGADTAAGKTGKLKKEVGMFDQAAVSAGKSVGLWLGGFASVSGITAAVKKLVDQIKEAAQIRSEFMETALTVDELTLKIANLPGRRDVSAEGLARVRETVFNIAKEARITPEVAGSALFFAESAMGTGKAAEEAAIAIGQFAAPAGLTPEDVKLLPKIFDAFKADTREKQMQILNQISQAAGSSIAETGEFVRSWMTTVIEDFERGLTLSQSLAKTVTTIQMTKATDVGGRMAKTVFDIVTGRTKQAVKFYTEQYRTPIADERGLDYEKMSDKEKKAFGEQLRKEGIDYTQMTDPERLEYARDLYKKFVKEKRIDEYKVVGGEGIGAVRLFFSETGERKYFESLPLIEGAKEADYVQKQAEQFKDTRLARQNVLKTEKMLAEGEAAMEREPQIYLDQLVETVDKQSKALMEGFLENIRRTFKWDTWEISRMIMRENLAVAIEQAEKGSKEYEELINLYERLATVLSYGMNPELIREAFEKTEGFQLIQQKGAFADWETIKEIEQLIYGPEKKPREFMKEQFYRPPEYFRGYEQFMGFREFEEIPEFSKGSAVNNAAIAEQTRILRNIDNKLGNNQQGNFSTPMDRAAEKIEKAANNLNRAVDRMTGIGTGYGGELD